MDSRLRIAETRQLDAGASAGRGAGALDLPAQFRTQPANYVVHGSEVEIARIIARELRQDHDENIVWAEGAFWAFAGTEWRPIPDQRLRLCVHGFDGQYTARGTPIKIGRRFIDGTIAELGTILAAPGFFDEPGLGINVENGTVTIGDDGAIAVKPHAPGDRLRFTIPARFDLHTPMQPPEGTFLHKLLHGAFAGDSDIRAKVDLVGEVLGAAALGIATRLPHPKAFIFLGETASNGKSTIANLLPALLPGGSISSIPLAAFGDERRIVNLAGKAANIADELSGLAVGGEAFKAAVTGNPIEGRDVYRSAVAFRPRALHCFTTNTLPRFTGGLDRGLQRRLIVVMFNRTIPKEEIISDIADRIRRDELDLVLGLAIAGARRLLRSQSYTMPPSSAAALSDWLMLDPVNEWFEARVTATLKEPPDGWPGTGRLYADFKSWATEHGHAERFLPPVNTFSQRLKGMSGVRIKRLSRGSVAEGVVLASKVPADAQGERGRTDSTAASVAW